MTYLHQYDSSTNTRWSNGYSGEYANYTTTYNMGFWCTTKQRYCYVMECSTCPDINTWPVWYPLYPSYTERHHAERCPICYGDGKKDNKDCHGCNGKGWVEVRG